MRAAPALAIFFLLTHPAMAELSANELSRVSASPRPGARIDLKLPVRDANGKGLRLGDALGDRPSFFVFVDYTCKNLCSTELQLLVAAIGRQRLNPSAFRIVVFGLDSKDPPRAARAMRSAEIPPNLQHSAVFLLPGREALSETAAVLGYNFTYDKAIDQFAHPAVMYVLTKEGAVRQVLSPFALLTADLRNNLALEQPNPTGLFQHIRLLCYGFAAATGLYNARIALLLRVAAIVTMTLLCAAILIFLWRERGRA